MKVLLDESLPRALKRELSAHEVTTVPEVGWAGKDNGELLELASGQFDVFVTADEGLQYQQNLSGYEIAVVTLMARTNRLEDLKPIIPKLLEVLPGLTAGDVVSLAA
jgi:predicted nuclease of predicted toxin-antitoxin system